MTLLECPRWPARSTASGRGWICFPCLVSWLGFGPGGKLALCSSRLAHSQLSAEAAFCEGRGSRDPADAGRKRRGGANRREKRGQEVEEGGAKAGARETVGRAPPEGMDQVRRGTPAGKDKRNVARQRKKAGSGAGAGAGAGARGGDGAGDIQSSVAVSRGGQGTTRARIAQGKACQRAARARSGAAARTGTRA